MAELISHKLCHKDRLSQYNTRFVNKLNMPPSANSKVSVANHWLAGFIQSDGSFQIKTLEKANRKKNGV